MRSAQGRKQEVKSLVNDAIKEREKY